MVAFTEVQMLRQLRGGANVPVYASGQPEAVPDAFESIDAKRTEPTRNGISGTAARC
jgi:hypothetical protein